MNAAVWFAAGVATGIAGALAAAPMRRAVAANWRSPALRYGLAVGAIVLCMIGFLATQLHSAGARTGRPSAQISTQASRPAPSLEAATAGLAQRLKEKGGTRDEWLLLARSYEFMGRTTEAQQARASAELAVLPVDITQAGAR